MWERQSWRGCQKSPTSKLSCSLAVFVATEAIRSKCKRLILPRNPKAIRFDRYRSIMMTYRQRQRSWNVTRFTRLYLRSDLSPRRRANPSLTSSKLRKIRRRQRNSFQVNIHSSRQQSEYKSRDNCRLFTDCSFLIGKSSRHRP